VNDLGFSFESLKLIIIIYYYYYFIILVKDESLNHENIKNVNVLENPKKCSHVSKMSVDS